MSLSHDEIEELLAAHALGELTDEQRTMLEAHTAECPGCDARLQDFERIVEYHAVDLAVSLGTDAEPSASVKQALFAQVRETSVDVGATELVATRYASGAEAEAQGRDLTERPTNVVPLRRRRRASWWSGVVAAPALGAACVALAVGVVVEHHRASSASTTAGAHSMLDAGSTAKVATMNEFASVHGELVQDQGAGVLVLAKVPPPPRGHVWHAWVEGPNHEMRSVEEIATGAPMMYVPVGGLMQAMPGGAMPTEVVVTDEQPGAQAPTGHMLARVAV